MIGRVTWLDGKAYIDGTPTVMLVENAKRQGWVSGPPPGTEAKPPSPKLPVKFQALTDTIHDEPEVISPPGTVIPDQVDTVLPPDSD